MCGVSQDIVHLCVFVPVDIKSTKACEEPPCCTQQTWRLVLSLLSTRGPTRNMLVHFAFPQMVSSRLHTITRSHTTEE